MTDDVLPAIVVPIAKILGGPKAEEHAKAYYEDLKQGRYADAVSDGIKSNMDIVAHATEGVARAWHAMGNEIAYVTGHDKPASTPPVNKGAAQSVKK